MASLGAAHGGSEAANRATVVVKGKEALRGSRAGGLRGSSLAVAELARAVRRAAAGATRAAIGCCCCRWAAACSRPPAARGDISQAAQHQRRRRRPASPSRSLLAATCLLPLPALQLSRFLPAHRRPFARQPPRSPPRSRAWRTQSTTHPAIDHTRHPRLASPFSLTLPLLRRTRMAAEFLVHRAVDGQSFAFPPGAVFETSVRPARLTTPVPVPHGLRADLPFVSSPCRSSRLDSLRRAVGELTCVDPADVIPFYGNGEQLREDNVLSAGSPGWDEVRPPRGPPPVDARLTRPSTLSASSTSSPRTRSRPRRST